MKNNIKDKILKDFERIKRKEFNIIANAEVDDGMAKIMKDILISSQVITLREILNKYL